jgi:pimeloyl-ACP methyl ester carboxylesterase
VISASDDERAYLEALATHSGIDAIAIDPPVRRYAKLNGLRFRYLEWGRRGTPPLVLLHGGGQTAHTWDACCLVLARRYSCFALDQRGHGDTEWSLEAAYEIEDYAADLGAFIEHLALPEPIVVGMSMGGINAIAYAAGSAYRLRALVSVDVGPEVQVEPVRRLMEGMDSYKRFKSVRHAAERMSALGARRARPLLQTMLSRNLREDADGSWTWKYDPRTLAMSTEDLLNPRKRLWTVLHQIRCPVLIVRGAASDIFSEADASEFARRLPRAARVTVPNARHAVQTDNPRGLAEAITAFDDALRRREGAHSGNP